MNKFLLLLVCLLTQTVFSQLDVRKTLNGRVFSDSISVEGISVFNKSSKRGAVTSPDGYFTLFAKPTDTLVFSSVQIKPTEIIIKDTDFRYKLFLVYLELSVNELEEITIRPKRFTGVLAKDSKGIPVVNVYQEFDSENISKLQFEADALTSSRNPAMLSDGTIPLGVDFKEVFKLIAPDIFKKKNKDREVFNKRQKFNDMVKSSYNEYFFTKILNLKLEDVDRFLLFCEDDPVLKPIVKDKNEFLLTEFLLKKRQTFVE